MFSKQKVLEHIPPSQRDMVTRLRAESFLDHSIPLGRYPAPRPEFGPTAERYFAWKHAAGPGPGRFYPLHELAFARPYHAGN